MNRPRLSIKQILQWADAHYLRTGDWPGRKSGLIPDSPEDTWSAVQVALLQGHRGLPGGQTLAKLLETRRGRRNRLNRPRLSIKKILQWADAHFRRTGRWPDKSGGAIQEAPGETWSGVNAAIRNGKRGQPGGSSLAKLLARAGKVNRRRKK